MKQKYKNKPHQTTSFLGGAYYHSSSICQGVKLCEFAPTQLKTLHHSELNDLVCTEVKDIQKDVDQLDDNDQPKIEAYK